MAYALGKKMGTRRKITGRTCIKTTTSSQTQWLADISTVILTIKSEK